jgi:hypothetical protein
VVQRIDLLERNYIITINLEELVMQVLKVVMLMENRYEPLKVVSVLPVVMACTKCDVCYRSENRYEVLRSPHKFKGGVSGCKGMCEARGKDFGLLLLIDGGWNLYVCGNGEQLTKTHLLFARQL